MKTFIDQYRTMIEEAAGTFTMTQLQEIVGVDRRNVRKWVDGSGFPRADSLAKLADAMGYRLVKTGLDSNDRIQAENFVKTKDGTYAREIDLADFEIVPLVKDPDLLSTDDYLLPDGNIRHYALVHKSTPTLNECSPNLIAVKVTEKAIGTLLEKSDVVIIDREDTEIENGRIYLVRTPEGQTMLRRVAIDPSGVLIFHSQNHNVTPLAFPLSAYGGDIKKAILGRGVRFRGDLRKL